jgi:hypothetical protein
MTQVEIPNRSLFRQPEVCGEGLTLAGVRRKLTEEGPSPAADASELNLTELMGEDARERILTVKRGLRELSLMLSRAPGTMRDEEFRLQLDEATPPKAKAARPVAVKKKK